MNQEYYHVAMVFVNFGHSLLNEQIIMNYMKCLKIFYHLMQAKYQKVKNLIYLKENVELKLFKGNSFSYPTELVAQSFELTL
jgi:hypothetical protein